MDLVNLSQTSIGDMGGSFLAQASKSTTTTQVTQPPERLIGLPEIEPWMFASVLVFAILIAGWMKITEWRAKQEIARWGDRKWAEREWAFLTTLDALASGTPYFPVSRRRLARRLGWERPEAVSAVQARLESAGMLTVDHPRSGLGQFLEGMGIKNDLETTKLSVTDRGIKYARNQLRDAPQALHQTVNAITVGGNVGDYAQFSAGSSGQQLNQAGSVAPRGYQTVSVTWLEGSVNWDELPAALESFRDALHSGGLSPELFQQAQRYLAEAEQLRRSRADEDRLRELVQLMYSIALGAAGSGLWAAVVAAFNALRP